jgi:Peptidase_C39 like family
MALQVSEGIRIWPPPSVLPDTGAATANTFALDANELTSLFALGGFPGKKISVPFVEQAPMALWCWVACTKMIVNSFGIAASRTEIAERHLSHLGLNPDCFPPVAGSLCDHECQPSNIAFIFSDWGLAVDNIPFDVRFLEFDEVKDEINAGRPVLVGVYWIEDGERRGGHVIVIRGWRIVDGEEMLYVNDPLGEKTAEVPYFDLLEEYGDDNSGQWQLTWTGFTPL